MGIAYMREGQSAVALQKLKQAIAIDPNYGQAHNVIAILYERLGKQELAAEHYARAVQLEPQDPYIRNARGSFFCKQSKYQEAEAEFESALSNPLYPTPWVAMTNAGLCAERSGDVVKAENFYRRALSNNQQYFQALYQMAELALQQGNFLSARGYLERYNAVAEPTAGSLWLGVQIESRLGDFDKASEYQRQLRDKFPDSPEIQLLNQSRSL
jgi:type IV pilus assembly protein PilF